MVAFKKQTLRAHFLINFNKRLEIVERLLATISEKFILLLLIQVIKSEMSGFPSTLLMDFH